MAVISYLIGLVLLVCSHRIIIASPFNSRSGFNCPDRTACSCDYVADYEIQCPRRDPIILLKVQPATYVQIECMTMDEHVYQQLPVMNLGDISMVQFRRCPLPGSGSSIQTILDRLGMKRIRSLTFLTYGADLGSTLVRQHLYGFTDLERLTLSGNGLSNLPEDLFNDVGNLTWLDLRSNKVHLPVSIFKNLKKLEYLELGYNDLKSIEPGVFKYQQKLKLLNLWGNDLQNLTKDSFEGVAGVEELDLSANHITALQPDVFSRLTNLTNINLNANVFRSLPVGLFSNNKRLNRIRLMDNRVDLETLPAGFLSNLPELENVNIKCGLTTVPGDMFNGTTNIKNLSMAENRLSTLPSQLFVNFSAILDLDLSRNQLIDLDDDLLYSMRSLLVLRLSHNQISIITEHAFSGLQSIQEIYMDNNILHKIHERAFNVNKNLENLQFQNNKLTFLTYNEDGIGMYNVNSFPFQDTKALRTLNLRNNSISYVLDDWLNVNLVLRDLDLSYNKFTHITLLDLNFLSNEISVNLTHNQIEGIDFDRYRLIIDDNESPPRSNKIYLGHNPLKCNCHVFNFLNYLHEQNGQLSDPNQMITSDLRCVEPERLAGRLLSGIHPKEILCELDPPNSKAPKLCPEQCVCDVRLFDRALIVNCSNANLSVVPELPNPTVHGLNYTELYLNNNKLRELPQITSDNINIDQNVSGYNFVAEIHADNNSITSLSVQNIPKNLRLLQLSHNNINAMNKSVLEALNATKNLQLMLLSHNPWYCDCNAKDFLLFAQDHSNQIHDLKNIKCHDGTLLKENGTSDLCPEDQTIIIAISAVMTLLGVSIGILVALYYKYQQEIKVWLFAHNLLTWFVTEYEVDSNKKYDAFVAYSHRDMDFVTESIVPGLESGSHPFKLCLHERDWLVGNAITQSIADSVESSRRTIIVLTRNFIESEWGKMEFRVAHKKSLDENRARVIVIVCGDVKDLNNEHLDEELKAYLKTNTYITWGDPWFWMKLRYAMPHPTGYKSSNSKGLLKTSIKSSIDDKLELIKPISVTPPLTTPPAELAGQKFQHSLNGTLNGSMNGTMNGSLNGHVNGAFIINTNAKQSDV